MRVFRLSGTVVGTEDAVLMDMFGMDYISAKMVHNYLEEAGGEDVIFNLNSGGGSVLAGSEIYTMLSSYAGRVTVNITGLSASIASVFMLGADEINMSHQAQIMIHQPRVKLGESVDSLEVERVKGMLDSTEKSLAKVYVKRTGLSESKILDMMFKETWLTSDEALELGFIDNIFEETDSNLEVVEDLVAMVNSVDNQLEILKEIKNLKGSSMNKSFLEKLRGILNDGEEVENTTETVVEETVVETPEKEETVEEVKEETASDVEEVVEESIEEDTDNQVELLEKAVNEIESLREENNSLKEEIEKLKAENGQLVTNNADLTAKDTKSKEIVAKLNALLASEEVDVVAVTQQTTNKSTMPVGYKGIRGGQN